MTLAEIRALISAATPGPWKHWTSDDDSATGDSVQGQYDPGRVPLLHLVVDRQSDADWPVIMTPGDAAFIAAARTLMPMLLDMAVAATSLREYADSPLPNAQLLYEDAAFDLLKALAALEAAKP